MQATFNLTLKSMKKHFVLTFLFLSLCGLLSAQTSSPLSVKTYQIIDNQHGNLGKVLNPGDRFGDRIRNIGDLDGDGISDMVVGADFDSTGGSNDGAIYILFMKKDGTVKSKNKITSGSFGYTFPSGYRFGQAVACIGDIDGDGVQDLAVTAITANNYEGAVIILFMKRDGTVKGYNVIDNNATNFTGVLSSGDLFGLDVTGMGDINGDSVNDIAVGAIGDNSGGTAYGAAYVIFLNKSGGVKSYKKISKTSGNFAGNFSSNDGFGVSVNNVGDINGDGINDLAIGAAEDNDDGNTTGAVFIARLSSAGNVKSYTKISNKQANMNNGIAAGSQFGMSETLTADLNGDGIKDMVVGAEYDPTGGSQTGAAYIIYLDDSANVKSYQKISNTTTGINGSLQSGGRFGVSVTDLGNLESDSTETIAVGNSWSSDSDYSEAGSVAMITLGTGISNNTNLSNLYIKTFQDIDNQHGNLGKVLNPGDRFGDRIRNIGDLDGDGISDMVVGADFDSTGGSNDGAIYILFMKKDGTVKSKNKITSGSFGYTFPSGYRFGQAVACIGDIDGDGVQDLAVTAITANNYEGAVIILFMKRDGTVKGYNVIDNNATNFTGVLSSGDLFGLDVTGMGDINGDSVNDIAVGAIGDNSGGTAYGAAYVIFLNKSGGVKSYKKISKTSGNFAGNFSSNDGFGVSVNNVGDINGDGINDLAIGAAEDNDDGNTTGAVFIARLSSAGNVKSYTKISNKQANMNNGIAAGSQFGMSETLTADLNGDGIKDMVVGAEYDPTGGSQTGAAYIIYLDDSANVKSYQKISNTTTGINGSLQSGGRFGVSVTDLGNLESDSTETIAVGNSWSSDSNYSEAGSVAVITFGGMPAHKALPNILLGQVTQSTGKALKNSEIYLLQYNWGDSVVTAVDSTITDTAGYYKFTLTATDTVVYLYASPDSSKYPSQIPTYDSSSTAFQFATAITPKTGTDTVNFSTRGGINPGGTGFIGGKITICNCKKAGAGQPVVGLKIILMNAGKPVAYTYTSKNGTFGFKNLANGSYAVYVDRPLIDNTLAPLVEISSSNNTQQGINFSLTPTQLEIVTTTDVENVITDKNGISLYPNPFAGSTHLNYHLSSNANVDVRLYNSSGKEVSIIASGMQNIGDYSYSINKHNSNITSGVYFIKYIIGNETSTIKIVNVE